MLGIEEESVCVWRIAANILDRSWMTADKVRLSALGVERHHRRIGVLRNV